MFREISAIWNLLFRIIPNNPPSMADRKLPSQIRETYSRHRRVYITREKFVRRGLSLTAHRSPQIIFRNGFHLTFRSNRGIKKFRA